MKPIILVITTLFATSLTTHGVPTLYLAAGDDVPGYHAGSGDFLGSLGSFPGWNLNPETSELTVGPDGALYNIGSGAIWRLDIETATVNPFVVFGEEVPFASGFAFADDGFLYVTSGDDLFRYDASTGALVGHIGNFPGNSFGAFSLLTFGPDGGLYTLGATPHAIWRTDVDAATSSPFVIFGEEVQQRVGGFVFAGGFIYVSAGDLLLRYDAQTGAFDGVVGSFPGAFTGSFSDNLLLGFDGRIYSQG